MDIDFMKSSASEDQIEMMMMEMDKLPDFVSYTDLSGMANVATPVTSAAIPFCDGLQNLHQQQVSPTISFSGGASEAAPLRAASQKRSSSMAAMREMIFRIAAMQPIHIDPESVKPPKRRNVRISTDPQSVAARHRRERISERIRILQRLVPGGTKMDTASMLDEAIHYVKFLKNQVHSLQRVAATGPRPAAVGFPVPMSSGSYHHHHHHHPSPTPN